MSNRFRRIIGPDTVCPSIPFDRERGVSKHRRGKTSPIKKKKTNRKKK